jgi:IstB-like ATP binding protein
MPDACAAQPLLGPRAAVAGAVWRDLRLPQELSKLDRFDLLILDDLSYVRRNQAETSVLFEFIAERYGDNIMAIAANTPFSQWGEVFVDRAMTLNDRSRDREAGTIVGQVFRPRDAGIVDKNVQSRELVLDSPGKGIDSVSIFYIQWHAEHAGAACGDLIEKVLATAGNEHPIAAPMQTLCKGTADAARSAGDQDGVAGESHSFPRVGSVWV